MSQRLLAAFATLWPRRMAAVLVLLSVAWSARGLLPGTSLEAPSGWLLALAALQLVAAFGLWFHRRWAWASTLLLQVASMLVGPLFEGRAMADVAWWLQQGVHAAIVALLLLPESRRSRASLREPGFEPGDTVPSAGTR